MLMTAFIGLVQNAALLLAIALIFDLIAPQYTVIRAERSPLAWLRQMPFSLLLGGLGLIVMLMPWRLTPDIEIDARTAILAISGLFFGPVPTIVAMLIMIVQRIFAGGIAMWASILTMLSVGSISMIWGHFHRGDRAEISGFEIYLLGVVTHIAMLAAAFGMPWEIALQVLASVGLPIIVILPLETALLGMLMVYRLRRRKSNLALQESEEQLQKSQALYRLLTENINDVVWILDVDTMTYRYNSPSVERLLGYTPQEMLLLPPGHTFPPQSSAGMIDLIQARADAFRTGQEHANRVYTDKVEHLRKHGDTVWTEVVTNCYTNRETGHVELLGVTRDITARKLAEDALQKNEANLNALISNSNDRIWAVDTDYRLIIGNSQFLEGIQASLKRTIRNGENVLLEEIPQNLRDLWRSYFDRALSGEIFSIESKMEFVEKPHYTEFSFHPIQNMDGGISGVVISGRDATERKRAEKELHIALEKYRVLFEAFPLGISITNAAGNIIEINRESERLLGIPRDEHIWRKYDGPEWRIVRSDKTPMPTEEYASVRAFREKRIVENEEMGIVKDGGEITWLSVTAAPIPLKDYGVAIVYGDINERKQTEEALRIAEASYRAIFERAPVGISQSTPQGRYLSVNPAMAHIYGYDSPEEMIASITDIGRQIYVNASDRQEFQLFVTEHGEVSDFISEQYRKDGSTIWTQITTRAEKDADGNFLYYEGFLRDITEQKRAEEALRESEEKFAKVFHDAPVWIAISDINNGTYLDMNEQALHETGFSREEVIGHTAIEIGWLKSDDRARLVQEIQDHGRIAGLEMVFYAKGGRPLQGWVNGEQIVIGGRPCLLTVTVDITERKQLEAKLLSSTRKFASAFNNNPHLMMISVISTGLLLEVNEAFVRETQFSRDELIGKTSNDLGLITPEDREMLERQLLATGEINGVETLLHRKDGSQFWVRYYAEIFTIDGEKSLLSIAQDISEQKRAEDEILEKSKELEALFTISSHLRTAQTAKDMLPVVLEQISKAINADANAVVLLDPDQTHFTYALGDGLLASNTGMQFDVDNSISGRVLQTRQPYVTLDFANDPLRSRAIPNREEVGAMAVVPLQSETEFVGTLLCARTKDSRSGAFTSAEVQLLASIGEMVGNALRRARLYDDSLSRLQRVQGLRSIDSFINANMDIKVTLNLIVNQSLSLMNVDAAAILLYNPHLHLLEYASAQGFHYKDIEKARFELSNTFSERAILERRIISASDPSNMADPVYKEMMQKERFVDCWITPMIAKGKVLGVMELYNHAHRQSDQEWLDFLEALGAQAAIAIDNAHLFRDLQASNFELILAYDATIQGWSHALDLKDKETEGHALRVIEMTIGIAKLSGLRGNEIIHIRRGALLHDIGKMGIPDRILHKTGKLTQKEWALIRQHPQFAYDMLHPIEFLRPALDIPYYHHEKWDGTGYPHGFKNIQIPYAARLFAVVDVWDALTSDRIYRKAWPKTKAFAYIREQSGKHFDPQAVDLFLKYMETMAARKK